MNINLDQRFGPDDGTIDDRIDEHMRVIWNQGRSLTGDTVLVSHPDPAYIGSYLVWFKQDDGTWVHVNTEGEVVEAACPIGD